MAVAIKDSTGGKPTFAQWEADRVLVITGMTEQPVLRFWNRALTRALVVVAEADGESWTCKVPNFLLMFDGPIFLSCIEDGDEDREVYSASYIVKPRVKPQDFTYEENIGYVNWVQMSQEAQDLVESIRTMLDNGELKGPKGDPGKFSNTAISLLNTILSEAVYKTDQTANIAALIAELSGGDVSGVIISFSGLRAIINNLQGTGISYSGKTAMIGGN